MTIMERIREFVATNDPVEEVAVLAPSVPAPPKSTKPQPRAVAPALLANDLEEYARVAAEVGVAPPDVTIEEFKAFLARHDIPTFSLAEVVAYMDKKAAEESREKAGWEWRPLREKDHRERTTFGQRASNEYMGHNVPRLIKPATDYYSGPSEWDRPLTQFFDKVGMVPTGQMVREKVASPNSVYDKTVPLHALRKVALIDKEFGGKVGIFVSDYATAPAINPDPFLMAVISNPGVNHGNGRFVIDFWDEPGFGIDRMLKTASG